MTIVILTNAMIIANTAQNPLLNEVQLMLSKLPFEGASVLELGCGKAEKTRTLAKSVAVKQIVAMEVDSIQHARNLSITDLPSVQFIQGGAEKIPAEDASFDVVIMLKSLHHVPTDMMGIALTEIARVLKPNGFAWISEPVFAGDLNEVFRIFHDEKTVRETAFLAVCQAVQEGTLSLKEQIFFDTRSHFDGFEQFDSRMIRVTHSDHHLSDETYQKVRAKFMSFMTADGATFRNPQRVDLLQKP